MRRSKAGTLHRNGRAEEGRRSDLMGVGALRESAPTDQGLTGVFQRDIRLRFGWRCAR